MFRSIFQPRFLGVDDVWRALGRHVSRPTKVTSAFRRSNLPNAASSWTSCSPGSGQPPQNRSSRMRLSLRTLPTRGLLPETESLAARLLVLEVGIRARGGRGGHRHVVRG